MRVADIQDREDLVFVSDTQDVRQIAEMLQAYDFDAFFVKVTETYEEVYGIEGTIPYVDKTLWKVL